MQKSKTFFSGRLILCLVTFLCTFLLNVLTFCTFFFMLGSFGWPIIMFTTKCIPAFPVYPTYMYGKTLFTVTGYTTFWLTFLLFKRTLVSSGFVMLFVVIACSCQSIIFITPSLSTRVLVLDGISVNITVLPVLGEEHECLITFFTYISKANHVIQFMFVQTVLGLVELGTESTLIFKFLML